MAPVIPETAFHQTEQRLYLISLFLLLQAYKVYELLFAPFPSSLKLDALDGAFVFAVPLLRVPRLTYGVRTRWTLFIAFAGLNWLACGGWRLIPFGSLVPVSLVQALTYYPTISSTSTRARPQDVIQPNQHLLGQFTLHISPFSTARFPVLPASQPLPCLNKHNPLVLVPITFNTTKPHLIEYSLTLPASQTVVKFNVSASSLEELRPTRALKEAYEEEEDVLEVEDLLELADQKRRREGGSVIARQSGPEALSSVLTQSNFLTLLLPVSQASTIQLLRVWSAKGAEFRVSPGEVRVFECPEVSFVPPTNAQGGRETTWERCVGEKGTLDVKVKGSGGGIRVGWVALDDRQGQESGFLEGIGEEDLMSAFGEIKDSDDDLPLVKSNAAPTLGTLAPQSYLASLPLSFTRPGSKTYRLFTVDSPHTHAMTVPSVDKETSFTYTVLPSPSLSFGSSCSSTSPIALLHPDYAPKHYVYPSLNLVADSSPVEGHPFEATLIRRPLLPGGNGGSGWTRDLKMAKRDLAYPVKEEGVYSLSTVRGGRCLGEIREPSECRVEIVPIPEVAMEIVRLQDDCAGELGFVASLSFRGTGPFELQYEVEKVGFREKVKRTKKFHHLQEQLVVQEKSEGTFMYRWLKVTDKNYPDGVPLVGERRIEDVEQVVHPLADAKLVDEGKRQVIWECRDKNVTFKVDLTAGKAPFTLNVLSVSPKSDEVHIFPGLKAGHQTITIPVPAERLASGGNFTISLGEIQDANGCKRRLSDSGLDVEVRRSRPTAHIYSKDPSRSETVARGKEVTIPLRLTGAKPWTVKYLDSNYPNKIQTFPAIKTENAQLTVSEAGTYTLLEVSDQHCPGSIVVEESSFTVKHLPLPEVRLPSSVGKLSKSGSAKDTIYIRPPVCAGVEDSISLQMQGQAPFKVEYSVSRDLHSVKHDSIPSAYTSVKVPLKTDEPGAYTYVFEKIGDANYDPRPEGVQGASSKSGKLILKQEVRERPSASFGTSSDAPISLCSRSLLNPTTSGGKALIQFRGQAPFDVTLHLHLDESSQPAVRHIKGVQSPWKIDLPDFEFEHVGMYRIKIASVSDASGCDRKEREQDVAELRVEVAETASVIPLIKTRDVCVGQQLDFLLQGTKPWNLVYEFNGASQRVKNIKNPKFSRLSDRPGTFAIKSITHEKNLCEVEINDIVREVHAIPDARISQGKNFIENVEEGDQAEIIFDLIGEPPFSFTYTRSEAGRPSKVLETHTVTGVMESSYSIFAFTEGTWALTMIEDRWCRYPPLAATTSTADTPLMLEGTDLFPPLW